MKITPINNTGFGKLYINDEDYSSVQSQYLCDISTKLNSKYGGRKSYSEKLEELGYDIWAKSAIGDKNNIRIILSKISKNKTELPRANYVASVGEFSTDFNPKLAINAAENNNKMDSILSKVLLGIAGILAILAVCKGCSEKATLKTMDSAAKQTTGKIGQALKNSSKTFFINKLA